MIFRFGFVLNVMSFWDVFFVKILIFVCYFKFLKDERKEVLLIVIRVNLCNIMRIFYYIIGYGIFLYCFFSLIVLLVMYFDVMWDFVMLF